MEIWKFGKTGKKYVRSHTSYHSPKNINPANQINPNNQGPDKDTKKQTKATQSNTKQTPPNPIISRIFTIFLFPDKGKNTPKLPQSYPGSTPNPNKNV